MPKPNAIIAARIRLDLPQEGRVEDFFGQEGGIGVELDGERRARLDGRDPRAAGLASVIEGLERLKHPAYVELDDSDAIRRLLIPRVGRISELRETGPGLELLLDNSHGRYLLPRKDDDFVEIEGLFLRSHDTGSPLIVVVDDDQRVVDARPYAQEPGVGPLPPFLAGPAATPLKRRWYDIFLFRGCVSRTRAQQVFDAMNATSCDPLTVPPPCIPFRYPDDGCWGRAHEMCRLMIAMGLSPAKVWIQGSLVAATRNHPRCEVRWGWHVAPTLCVRIFLFWTRRMVIDPALFATPVTEASWKGAQGDPAATLTPSDASIFYLWGSQTDPAYTQTNIVLATYRLALQNRSIASGPPPYAHCP